MKKYPKKKNKTKKNNNINTEKHLYMYIYVCRNWLSKQDFEAFIFKRPQTRE